MDPMHAAIRKRKSGGMLGDHQASHESVHADVGDGKDLHGLVAGLSDHEKGRLQEILSKDASQGIAQGNPSTEEKGKIAQASAEENQENALEESQEASGQLPPDESDEIAKSMLDSRNLRGTASDKPRNLGERMKMSLANKLKAKGKI